MENLQFLSLFDGRTLKFRPCLTKTLLRGYFPSIKQFDGDVNGFVPCFMELSGIYDPVWWRNEKNRTLFDGEMKKIGPCLMEKWNIFDPVWWKNSRKRTLFGPSIVYRRALEFHPRALRLYFPNSDERHGVSDKPELMALLILKLLSTVLRGTVLY